MISETENLVLAQLRAIRAALADHGREFGELRARMSSVERRLADMRRELAGVREDFAVVHSRLDGLTERMDRIDRRLAEHRRGGRLTRRAPFA